MLDLPRAPRVFVYGILGALAACSGGAGGAGDAGAKPQRDAAAPPDAGPAEASTPDAAAGSREHDAGARDAGRVDAGIPDAAPADAAPADAGPMDAAPPPRTHGLQARIENATCFVDGTPPLDVVPVANTPAYAALTASGAVALVSAPDGKLALVESGGLVRTFAADGDGSDAATALDLRTGVRAGGLRGAAFRPDGSVLVASFLPADDPLRLVVARFDLDAGGSAVPRSEQDLLTLPLSDATRAGGALSFLFDGTLVVAFGDGGTAADATDPGTLAGKVARIDVGAASSYAVPVDNPFASSSTTLPEIYALGLGAPSSCSVDRVNGRLWCADSGDATHDHILLVTPGATLSPILSYTRGSGDCGAVLGFVSREAKLPDIEGVLVFGDACSPALQGMRFDGSLVRSQAEVSTLPAALSGFGQDADGRILAVDSAGAIHALVRPTTAVPSFPTSVSATGCLADMATRMPAASLIPFEVRTPLWSDGATKRRFLILPGSETVGFTTEGAWQLPVGAMLMKEFLLDDDDDPSTPDRIMETRFLIKRSDTGWEGYSYMWDPARKDGFLLDGAEIGRFPMQPGALDPSGASVHRHTFPDRAQCLLCHNAAAGRTLGLQTGRMNTDHDYDGFVENQLAAMDHIGLFGDPLPAAPDDLPRFAQPRDTSAPLEARARSWLYANCSHCHRPGGPTPVPLDFRYETALADTHACGVTPQFAIGQIPNAEIIFPGSSAQSELFFRLSRRDANQMPPVATLIVDPSGLDVVQQWIDGLGACP